MNPRNTFIIFIVFLALVGIAVYVDRQDTSPRDLGEGTATPTPEALFAFEPADVQEVHLLGDLGETTLRRTAGGWEVDGQPANDFAGGTLERVANPRVIRDIPADRDPDTYGFATPTLTVTLKLQDGGEHVLAVGDDAPVDPYVYVRVPASGRIVLITASDVNTLKGWLTEPPLAPTPTPPPEEEEVEDDTTEDVAEADQTATAEAEATAEDDGDATPEGGTETPDAFATEDRTATPTPSATLPPPGSPTP